MAHRPAQISGMIRTLAAGYAIQIPPTTANIVSIADVKVSSDLSYADIFVSAITGAPAAVKFLASKKGAMRKTLAAQMRTHRVPILRFKVDTETARVTKLDEILESL